jgi:hypothetical protein
MRQWGDIKIMAASEYNTISQDLMCGMPVAVAVGAWKAMVKAVAKVEEVEVGVVYTPAMMDQVEDILQEDLQTLLMF